MIFVATIAKQKYAYDFLFMGFHVTSSNGEVFECRSERPRKYIKTESKEDAMKKIKKWRMECSW